MREKKTHFSKKKVQLGLSFAPQRLQIVLDHREEKFTSEITEQSSARALSDVVSHVQNPKPEHEKGHSVGAMVHGVTEPPAKVRGVTNDENRDDDRHGSAENKRSPAPESAGAPVTHVAHEGLYQEPREGAAEPYDAGPRVRDSELLHVRREKRELQGPSKLNATGHRRYPKQLRQRNPVLRLWSNRRGRRSSLGPVVLATGLAVSFWIRHCAWYCSRFEASFPCLSLSTLFAISV